MLSDRVWDWLEPATVAFENVSRSEVENGIASGDFQLFITEHSAAVTCAFGKSLRIGLAGGDLDELLDMEKDICAYARSHDFDSIEIIGRPGWERALAGYRRTAVLMRKELDCHGLH
tara:strand:- start:790 stop:1140 length:351 start_codon:yes stop_codon:yes gene_type:complete